VYCLVDGTHVQYFGHTQWKAYLEVSLIILGPYRTAAKCVSVAAVTPTFNQKECDLDHSAGLAILCKLS